jgi:hypothetical protein
MLNTETYEKKRKELQEVRRLLDERPNDVELQQREQALNFDVQALAVAMRATLIMP